MVGELWRGEADFSLRLFWSAARKEAIDFTRAYIFEPFVMITRKPGPLPQHLAPIKPFTGDIWIALVVTTTLAGAILWGAQRAWSRFSGGRGLDAVSAFLYTLGMLLAEPTDALPTNITAQMLVGSWWVFCVVVVAMYRGSLIAHLTAPVNPSPIDTLDQLLEVEGATWGLEGGHGVGWDWFKYNTNPKVQHMFTTMQVTPREEQLARVLGGQHAFFTWKYYIKMVVALHHTDIYGHTPLHISKQEFISGQSGWGVSTNVKVITNSTDTRKVVHEPKLAKDWSIVSAVLTGTQHFQNEEITRATVRLPDVNTGTDVVCLSESAKIKGLSFESTLSNIRPGGLTDILVLNRTDCPKILKNGCYLCNFLVYHTNVVAQPTQLPIASVAPTQEQTRQKKLEQIAPQVKVIDHLQGKVNA
ncbi:ionotropic receptor 21a-like [Homarus americanus]|uniref:ionotropic receptor 21a-like n=1 Tax=Homarus americanus TaxID=6706 RepID=UPI001C4788FA|nr:ionotropic receptor 21a-like [Homarus americanus]